MVQRGAETQRTKDRRKATAKTTAPVEALAKATPKDTGKTAASWSYTVTKGKESITITWRNSNIVDGVPIAVILQYGHGTRNGGYVEGVDYINPAMRPIFERIAARAWGEVRTE